jgi:hypothetical protein
MDQLDPKTQAQIKQYLADNLTLSFSIEPDMYGVNNDQITLNLNLEGETINTIILYSLTGS